MAPDATTYDPTAEAEEQIVREVERNSWWCGGGIKPQNGKDLGVFEASLEDRANCLSLWSLSYLNPLLSLGSRKVLDSGDVGVPSKQDRAETSYGLTKAEWDKQVEIAEAHNKKIMEAHAKKAAKCKTEADIAKLKPPTLKEPSVAKALAKSFGMGRFTMALVYYVLSSLLSFVPVLILNDLVKYFEHVSVYGTKVPYDSFVNPWIEVAGLGVVPLIVSALQTRHQGKPLSLPAPLPVSISSLTLNLVTQSCQNSNHGTLWSLCPNCSFYHAVSQIVKRFRCWSSQDFDWTSCEHDVQ